MILKSTSLNGDSVLCSGSPERKWIRSKGKTKNESNKTITPQFYMDKISGVFIHYPFLSRSQEITFPLGKINPQPEAGLIFY
jgi:hypothetical protein